MKVLPGPSTAFTSGVNTDPWLRAGASVTLMAACLTVFDTYIREGPVLVSRLSASGGSVADGQAELRPQAPVSLPPVRVTSDAAEMIGRRAAIGTAARAARHAVQGEIFTPAVAENVRALITADMTRRSAADRASLMSEVPSRLPRVNEPYPAGEALATFPPLLLQTLPRLPHDLEYRFMGPHLIIRDGRTNLIVDYLLEVTSARKVKP